MEFQQTRGPLIVRGFLHQPSSGSGDGLVLAHGAGSDARSPLLTAIAASFEDRGFVVLRIDLPYRQARPGGAPHPSLQGRDREGILAALDALHEIAPGRSFVGGQSYGGRMASMVAAEKPDRLDGLLLTSYPLHPPGKPNQLRTEHLSGLRLPCLFVHGTKDPFGSIDELETALRAIPGPVKLLQVTGAGHDLGGGRKFREVWSALPDHLEQLTRTKT